MWSNYFETVYFCANCEEEISGMPAGSRIHSGRPLCLRCTHIGLEEGWAQSQEQCTGSRKESYSGRSKQGIMALAFLLVGALGLVALYTLAFIAKK